MSRPSTVFIWATLPPTGYIFPPPGGVVTTGFGPSDVYAPAAYNSIFQDIADWIGYLATLSPSTGVLNTGLIVGNGSGAAAGYGLQVLSSVGQISVLTTTHSMEIGVAGGTGQVVIATGGSGNVTITTAGTGDVVLSSSDDVSITAADNITITATDDLTLAATNLSASATVQAQQGVSGAAKTSTNVVYAYASARDYTVTCGPDVQAFSTGSDQYFIEGTEDFATILNGGGTITVGAWGLLPGIMQTPSDGPGANTTQVYEARTMTVSWYNNGATNRTSVRVQKKLKGSGGGGTYQWSTLGSFTLTCPAGLVGDKTDATTGVLSEPLNVKDYDYRVIVSHTPLAGGELTDGIKSLRITLRKVAVE